jgi:hypothetical protein
MTDDHDVLHLEHIDGELEHREIIRVLRGCEIGDVAVHEQLTGIEADDLVRGHPAVGASDPQILGRMLSLEPAEEAFVGGDLAPCPVAIVGLQMIEHDAIP